MNIINTLFIKKNKKYYIYKKDCQNYKLRIIRVSMVENVFYINSNLSFSSINV